MNPATIMVAVALLTVFGMTQARAECQIANAKLEEAIQQKPELRGPANPQTARVRFPQSLTEARQLLSIPDSEVKTVPLMPDQDYKWLSDAAWRTRNDARFARR